MSIEDGFMAADRLRNSFRLQGWTDDVVDQWAEALADLDPGLVDEAITELVSTQERVSLSAVFGQVHHLDMRRRGDDRRLDTLDCANGCDLGWVETGNGLKPCYLHRADTYEVWREGRFDAPRRPAASGGGRKVPAGVREFRDRLRSMKVGGGPKRTVDTSDV